MVVLPGGMIFSAVALYWELTRKKEFLGYFPNSPWILGLEPLKHATLFQKIAFIGALAGGVTSPKGHIKRGEISAQDLENLPAPVRRQLAIMWWTNVTLSVLLIVSGIIYEAGWIVRPE
jgi:hypothetical protein